MCIHQISILYRRMKGYCEKKNHFVTWKCFYGIGIFHKWTDAREKFEGSVFSGSENIILKKNIIRWYSESGHNKQNAVYYEMILVVCWNTVEAENKVHQENLEKKERKNIRKVIRDVQTANKITLESALKLADTCKACINWKRNLATTDKIIYLLVYYCFYSKMEFI